MENNNDKKNNIKVRKLISIFRSELKFLIKLVIHNQITFIFPEIDNQLTRRVRQITSYLNNLFFFAS